MQQEITCKQLEEASEIASRLGDKYAFNVLTSMSKNLMKWGKLTPRQATFARNLIGRNSTETTDAHRNWVNRVKNDEELQERIRFIANYYATTPYFSSTSSKCINWLLWFKEEGDQTLPSEEVVMKMIDNKFSNKTWESHKGPQIWNAGDLVQIRKNAGIKFPKGSWVNREILRRGWIWMIVESNPRPIDRTIGYDKKKGGSRYYRLIQLGGTQQIDVIECELKRVPKKLLK
jgi:hypothetical protein